jgi:hypothetical protein
MTRAQWTVIITVATVGALFLVSLGGLAGWALFQPTGFSWSWPWHMASWMGPGMMAGWPGFSGMMGSTGACGFQGVAPGGGDNTLGLEDAQAAVDRYLASANQSDLVISEVMEFDANFYAEVEEPSTGVHAMELLIDKKTGTVYPEYGPNMMWNTRYGMRSASVWRGWMGGMMGGFSTQEPSADMPVSPARALENAQRYLDASFPGTHVADEADVFYGYYTVHVLDDSGIYGMLSVNRYTGDVWYHDWHGRYLDMLEAHES